MNSSEECQAYVDEISGTAPLSPKAVAHLETCQPCREMREICESTKKKNSLYKPASEAAAAIIIANLMAKAAAPASSAPFWTKPLSMIIAGVAVAGAVTFATIQKFGRTKDSNPGAAEAPKELNSRTSKNQEIATKTEKLNFTATSTNSVTTDNRTIMVNPDIEPQ
ncbi:MAG: hypothetical protein HQM10_08125 [Candidatus Riflebacteria bacterium]|nr:hypothetical protein [Candidatus Riflebacteria bacterium]